MTEQYIANTAQYTIIIFIEQLFRARWSWSIGVLESWLSMSSSSSEVPTSSILRIPSSSLRASAATTYSDHSWGCLPQPGTKRRGVGVLKMEYAGTSEEDDDIDSQDSNRSMDQGPRASAASTPTATTPEDVSHSRGRNVEGKESWEWKTPGLRKKTTTSTVRIPTHR